MLRSILGGYGVRGVRGLGLLRRSGILPLKHLGQSNQGHSPGAKSGRMLA